MVRAAVGAVARGSDLSGGLYIPVEIYELWRRPSRLGLVVLVVNVAVVGVMVYAMVQRRRAAGVAGATRYQRANTRIKSRSG